MILKEEEKTKVYSSEVKKLEKILLKIQREEERLLFEFDTHAEEILGTDLIERLKNEKILDTNKNEVSLLAGISPKTFLTRRGKVVANYSGILTTLHKSQIKDPTLRRLYEKKVSAWFKQKNIELQVVLDHKDTARFINKYVPRCYALATLATLTFHKMPNMRLRDVQKLAGIAISNGDIAELGTGEGKTLAAVLPVYLHALRGKGVHVVTANSYLSKRDYDELKPIFNGLGLSVGFLPESVEDLAMIEGRNFETLSYEEKINYEKKLVKIKKEAYQNDITYGAKSVFAFDYLRDTTVTNREDILQREENPGFALIDEIDDVLIDDAQCPYILGGNLPVYKKGMTLVDLADALNKSFEEVKEKVNEARIDVKVGEELDYEKARYIANSLYSKELIMDKYSYRRKAQSFYRRKVKNSPWGIYEVGSENFGISNQDLYDILTGDDKTITIRKDKETERRLRNRIEEIKNNSFIIYDREKKRYQINDRCYDAFLTECYIAFQLKTILKGKESSIASDYNYILGRDYNVSEGEMLLTLEGASKLIKDANHPEFSTDFKKYINNVYPFSSEILHFFDEAVKANLVMNTPEDYVVKDGKIMVVKNSRIQDGSTYSDGLHQALEFKEGIALDDMVKENETIASITQKDFYNRYDAFSGMTGTSSKDIFRRIFAKKTVQIPKNDFYTFFNRRARKKTLNPKEPLGIEKKDPIFSKTDKDKMNLIVASIKKSLSNNPMQPVLLVVSNSEELALVDKTLTNEGIKHNLLTATTDKQEEALIIAKAGLPGSVTVSTEMAGRGTDIKLGGDRNTFLDIITDRFIKKKEAELKTTFNLSSLELEEIRNSIETSLLQYSNNVSYDKRKIWSKEDEERDRKALDQIGLKVISSGYFKVDRIDRQLEGRTGRNGSRGVCERFVSPSDFEHLGITEIVRGTTVKGFFDKFPTDNLERVILDKSNYRRIREKIRITQNNNEEIISQNIMNSQEISLASTKIIERYRNERKEIIFDDDSLDEKVQEAFETTIDTLITSHIVSGKVKRSSLLSELERGDLTIDFETFALEAKEVLGININPIDVSKSHANLLEFRNALLSFLIERREEGKAKDPKNQIKKEREALLAANDYVVANIPAILDSSLDEKSLTSLAMGMEAQTDYMAAMEFDRTFRKVQLESSKIATKTLVGKTLSMEECKKLEARKEQIFGPTLDERDDIGGYTYTESKRKENDAELVDRFKTIRKPIEEKNNKQKGKIDKRVLKRLDRKEDVDPIKPYLNLQIRPVMLVKAIKDSYYRLALKKGIPPLLEAKNNEETFHR